MAATFSITGIATLFSGYFLTVALMMGTLEFAKIVVASFLARYWGAVSRILRGYFIAALVVLILITSGGIFGYLSDAYQRTKGDYTVVEKQTEVLKNKKNRYDANIELYQTEKQQIDGNINNLILALQGNKITYTDENGNVVNTTSSAARKLYEKQLTENQARRDDLTQKIDAAIDSSSAIDIKIFDLESQNIQGELGPLKYIAGIFNTDMDTVVKYFIFLLIFVFDPLAVLLFVSLNTIIRKERGIYEEDDDDGGDNPEPDTKEVTVTVDTPEMKTITTKLKDDIDKKLNDDILDETLKTIDVAVENLKDGVVSEPIDLEPEIEPDDKKDDSESFVDELIEGFEKQENPGGEHEFYHGEKAEEKVEEKKEKKPPMIITKKSANYHPQPQD